MAEYVGIDFTKKDKDVLVFTLPDGEGGGFELHVKTPTARGYRSLAKLADTMDKWGQGELDAEEFDMDAVLGAVAEAMSNNKEKRAVTREYLESVDFDLDDATDFVGAYIGFLMLVAQAKNSPAPGPTRGTGEQGPSTGTR